MAYGSDSELERLLESYARRIYDKVSRATSRPRASGKPVHVESVDMFMSLLNGNEILVVDFWADWCVPCHMYAPVFEEVAKRLADIATFAKVNVEELPEIAQEYGVLNIPTTMIFVHGKPIDRIIGAVPEVELERRVLRAKSIAS